MKKIILLLSITLTGCFDMNKERERNTQSDHKLYQRGDIVYLKPDSLKVVITYDQQLIGKDYSISYEDSLHVRHEIDIYQYEIFGK